MKKKINGLFLLGGALFWCQLGHSVEFKATGFGSFYYANSMTGGLLPYGFKNLSGYPSSNYYSAINASTGATTVGGSGVPIATATSLSGALTAGGINNNYGSSQLLNNNADFLSFSLIGADLSVKVDERFSFAGELVVSGNPQGYGVPVFSPYTVWGYANWNPMDSMSVRLGRQRYALWTASEFVYNHEQLPYREIPSIVYRVLPFAAFDGASITQKFDLGFGGLKGNISLFGGTPQLEGNFQGQTYNFFAKNLLGVKLTLDGDGFRVRGQISRMYAEFDAQADNALVALGLVNQVNTANLLISTVGYRFDKYNFVTWGEYGVFTGADGNAMPIYVASASLRTRAAQATALGLTAAAASLTGAKAVLDNLISTNGRGDQAFKIGQAGYVLVGYHIGDFMPRFTYAQAYQDIGFLFGGVTSYTTGLDYRATERIVARLEWEVTSVASNIAAKQNSLVTYESGITTATAPNVAHTVYLGLDFTL